MIKKKLIDVADSMEGSLRSLLERITPDGRVVIILVLLFLFGAGSIYMTVSSIYNIGKKNARQEIQIEHIKRLELEHKQKADSIKQIKRFDYE